MEVDQEHYFGSGVDHPSSYFSADRLIPFRQSSVPCRHVKRACGHMDYLNLELKDAKVPFYTTQTDMSTTQLCDTCVDCGHIFTLPTRELKQRIPSDVTAGSPQTNHLPWSLLHRGDCQPTQGIGDCESISAADNSFAVLKPKQGTAFGEPADLQLRGSQYLDCYMQGLSKSWHDDNGACPNTGLALTSVPGEVLDETEKCPEESFLALMLSELEGQCDRLAVIKEDEEEDIGTVDSCHASNEDIQSIMMRNHDRAEIANVISRFDHVKSEYGPTKNIERGPVVCGEQMRARLDGDDGVWQGYPGSRQNSARDETVHLDCPIQNSEPEKCNRICPGCLDGSAEGKTYQTFAADIKSSCVDGEIYSVHCLTEGGDEVPDNQPNLSPPVHRMSEERLECGHSSPNSTLCALSPSRSSEKDQSSLFIPFDAKQEVTERQVSGQTANDSKSINEIEHNRREEYQADKNAETFAAATNLNENYLIDRYEKTMGAPLGGCLRNQEVSTEVILNAGIRKIMPRKPALKKGSIWMSTESGEELSKAEPVRKTEVKFWEEMGASTETGDVLARDSQRQAEDLEQRDPDAKTPSSKKHDDTLHRNLGGRMRQPRAIPGNWDPAWINQSKRHLDKVSNLQTNETEIESIRQMNRKTRMYAMRISPTVLLLQELSPCSHPNDRITQCINPASSSQTGKINPALRSCQSTAPSLSHGTGEPVVGFAGNRRFSSQSPARTSIKWRQRFGEENIDLQSSMSPAVSVFSSPHSASLVPRNSPQRYMSPRLGQSQWIASPDSLRGVATTPHASNIIHPKGHWSKKSKAINVEISPDYRKSQFSGVPSNRGKGKQKNKTVNRKCGQSKSKMKTVFVNIQSPGNVYAAHRKTLDRNLNKKFEDSRLKCAVQNVRSRLRNVQDINCSKIHASESMTERNAQTPPDSAHAFHPPSAVASKPTFLSLTLRRMELQRKRQKRDQQRNNLKLKLQGFHGRDVNPREKPWQNLLLESNHKLRLVLPSGAGDYEPKGRKETPSTKQIAERGEQGLHVKMDKVTLGQQKTVSKGHHSTVNKRQQSTTVTGQPSKANHGKKAEHVRSRLSKAFGMARPDRASFVLHPVNVKPVKSLEDGHTTDLDVAYLKKQALERTHTKRQKKHRVEYSTVETGEPGEVTVILQNLKKPRKRTKSKGGSSQSSERTVSSMKENRERAEQKRQDRRRSTADTVTISEVSNTKSESVSKTRSTSLGTTWSQEDLNESSDVVFDDSDDKPQREEIKTSERPSKDLLLNIPSSDPREISGGDTVGKEPADPNVLIEQEEIGVEKRTETADGNMKGDTGEKAGTASKEPSTAHKNEKINAKTEQQNQTGLLCDTCRREEEHSSSLRCPAARMEKVTISCVHCGTKKGTKTYPICKGTRGPLPKVYFYIVGTGAAAAPCCKGAVKDGPATKAKLPEREAKTTEGQARSAHEKGPPTCTETCSIPRQVVQGGTIKMGPTKSQIKAASQADPDNVEPRSNQVPSGSGAPDHEEVSKDGNKGRRYSEESAISHIKRIRMATMERWKQNEENFCRGSFASGFPGYSVITDNQTHDTIRTSPYPASKMTDQDVPQKTPSEEKLAEGDAALSTQTGPSKKIEATQKEEGVKATDASGDPAARLGEQEANEAASAPGKPEKNTDKDRAYDDVTTKVYRYAIKLGESVTGTFGVASRKMKSVTRVISDVLPLATSDEEKENETVKSEVKATAMDTAKSDKTGDKMAAEGVSTVPQIVNMTQPQAVQDIGKPPSEATAPKTETGKPPNEATAPKTETGKPPSEVTVPEKETGKPPSEATVPKTDSGKPPSEVIAPKTDSGKPPSEVIAPKTDSGKPPREVTAPETDSGKPPSEVTVPETDARKPPREVTAPETGTPYRSITECRYLCGSRPCLPLSARYGYGLTTGSPHSWGYSRCGSESLWPFLRKPRLHSPPRSPCTVRRKVSFCPDFPSYRGDEKGGRHHGECSPDQHDNFRMGETTRTPPKANHVPQREPKEPRPSKRAGRRSPRQTYNDRSPCFRSYYAKVLDETYNLCSKMRNDRAIAGYSCPFLGHSNRSPVRTSEQKENRINFPNTDSKRDCQKSRLKASALRSVQRSGKERKDAVIDLSTDKKFSPQRITICHCNNARKITGSNKCSSNKTVEERYELGVNPHPRFPTRNFSSASGQGVDLGLYETPRFHERGDRTSVAWYPGTHRDLLAGQGQTDKQDWGCGRDIISDHCSYSSNFYRRYLRPGGLHVGSFHTTGPRRYRPTLSYMEESVSSRCEPFQHYTRLHHLRDQYPLSYKRPTFTDMPSSPVMFEKTSYLSHELESSRSFRSLERKS